MKLWVCLSCPWDAVGIVSCSCQLFDKTLPAKNRHKHTTFAKSIFTHLDILMSFQNWLANFFQLPNICVDFLVLFILSLMVQLFAVYWHCNFKSWCPDWNIRYQKYRVSEISGLRNIGSLKYWAYWVSEISGLRNIGSQKYQVSEISVSEISGIWYHPFIHKVKFHLKFYYYYYFYCLKKPQYVFDFRSLDQRRSKNKIKSKLL